MHDWICTTCGQRLRSDGDAAICPGCNRPMTEAAAIATPHDAAAARMETPESPGLAAFSEGPPPVLMPLDRQTPSIQLSDQPTRRCPKCGSLMSMYHCEQIYHLLHVPEGKKMYYRCAVCRKEIMLRSAGRILLIALACPFFFLFFWLWLKYGGWGPLIFVVPLAIYPILLVSELVTRLRYARAGGGLARSLGRFTMRVDPPTEYDTLFGDLPLGRWPEGSPIAEPWNWFVEARRELAAGRHDSALGCWREVLAQPALHSRHYLQAWYFLRRFGEQPPPEIAGQVLGVAVEVGMPQGRESPALYASDILVAYADRSARYYNFSGAGIVWEHANESLDKITEHLFSAAAENINDFDLLHDARRPPPDAGQVRLTLLTPSGLFLRQGSMDDLESNPATRDLMQIAARLLPALMNKAIHTGQTQ